MFASRSRCFLALLTVLVATTACGNRRAAPGTSSASPTGASPAPCERVDASWLPQPGKTAVLTLQSAGVERTALVRLPKSFDADNPTRLPLMVDFHGHGGSGNNAQRRHGFDTLADRDDIVMVYPDGTIQASGGRGWATGSVRDRGNIDDVAFVAELLTRLDADLCLDPTRRWAVGHSNGGGLVGILACETPQRFTAFAAVAGAFYGTKSPCNPGVAVKLLEIHGDDDRTVAYLGSTKSGLAVFPPIQEWLADWAARQGCSPMPTTEPTTGALEGEKQEWACPEPAVLTHVRLPGGSHAWPDGAASAIVEFVREAS